MQRHPNLVPLSHEHKRLLFVCRYLKINAAPYEGYPLETEAKMEYMVKIFQEVMVPHIQKEDYLFEQCRGYHADIDIMLDELMEEHRIISRMYSALVDSEDVVKGMDELACSLETHIRKEERVVFEKLQELLPEVIAQINFENS